MVKWILQVRVEGKFRDLKEGDIKTRTELFDHKRSIEQETGGRCRDIQRRTK